jgi:hypothetical protein
VAAAIPIHLLSKSSVTTTIFMAGEDGFPAQRHPRLCHATQWNYNITFHNIKCLFANFQVAFGLSKLRLVRNAPALTLIPIQNVSL